MLRSKEVGKFRYDYLKSLLKSLEMCWDRVLSLGPVRAVTLGK